MSYVAIYCLLHPTMFSLSENTSLLVRPLIPPLIVYSTIIMGIFASCHTDEDVQ